MQARAGAIDELLASGALENHVSGTPDYIQAELDRMGASNEIEAEMARLRGELPSGPEEARKELGSGAGEES
jgi:phage shock protein A